MSHAESQRSSLSTQPTMSLYRMSHVRLTQPGLCPETRPPQGRSTARSLQVAADSSYPTTAALVAPCKLLAGHQA